MKQQKYYNVTHFKTMFTALGAVTGDCRIGYYCGRGSERDDPTDGVTGNICPAGRYCSKYIGACVLSVKTCVCVHYNLIMKDIFNKNIWSILSLTTNAKQFHQATYL